MPHQVPHLLGVTLGLGLLSSRGVCEGRWWADDVKEDRRESKGGSTQNPRTGSLSALPGRYCMWPSQRSWSLCSWPSHTPGSDNQVQSTHGGVGLRGFPVP
jgi:hypothetical protein